MIRSDAHVEIARPVTTVYGFVVHEFVANYPRWSPEVVELEPLDGRELALGRRTRQVRVDRGRRSETVVRVTALEEPHHVEFTSEQSPWFRIRFEFTPGRAGTTELAFRFELTRVELYMRPFTRLIRRALQDGSERVVANIRDLIEAER